MSTHACSSCCGVQTRSLPALTRLQPPRFCMKGRNTRLTCSADSRSSNREPSTVQDQLAAKQRTEKKKRIDRADLYTDNWGGDVWKGSKVNVLSIILAVSILVPLGGLLFAYLTFGTLWG